MVEYTPFVGSQRLTGLAASTGLTVPSVAKWALLMPQTQAVHVSLGNPATGGAGTATTTDMKIAAGTPCEVTSDLADVRIIEAAASATVDVWYFG